MARGRLIDKRVSMSKKIGRAPDKARVLWFMVYPHLDREGRIAFDDLEDLQYEIIPRLNNWGLKKIAQALNDLADINLIHLYPNKGKIAIQFVRFEDFQVGLRKEREAESKIDSPEVAPENSGDFRITPALSLKKYKEVNEVKKKKAKKEKSKKTSLFEKEFEEFWKAYPKKVAKQYAKEKFMILARKGEAENITKALNGYLSFLKYQRTQNNFNQEPLNPATFLMKDRWKDYLDFKHTEPGQRTSNQSPEEEAYWEAREAKEKELKKQDLNESEVNKKLAKWSEEYWREL